MNSKPIILAALFGLSFASFASFTSNAFAADDCIVHYNRTACPGKEDESYSKCGGTQQCDKNEDASTEAACISLAKAACANSRLEITKSKRITARFNGKALSGPFGGSFCAPNRPDFNKCKS